MRVGEGCFVKRALPYLLAINMDFLKQPDRTALEKETDLGIKICSILSTFCIVGG